jgi:hypothetical protein
MLDLGTLGKIAGLGGIAVGVTVMLVRPLIARAATLPKDERGPTMRLIALGAFAIGALGIIAWSFGGSGGSHVTGNDCGITAGRDATANSLSCGSGHLKSPPAGGKSP